MLANADYVIMGAGIPMEVPGILDALAKNDDCKLVIDVDGSEEVHYAHFSPKEFWTNAKKPELAEVELKRPNFLPIVSSVMLAQAMLKRASGAGPTKGIQGFVIEMPTAGGHNAPPRGFRYDAEKKSHNLSLNERGEPVYGPKDEVDLAKFKKSTKDLPFWLAGYYARPEKLQEVLAIGGQGVQVGTSFAFAKESGLAAGPKEEVLRQVASGDLSVFTDPVASPTGFPFKVLELEDSLSEKAKYDSRPACATWGTCAPRTRMRRARWVTAAPRSPSPIGSRRAARSRPLRGASACATGSWPTPACPKFRPSRSRARTTSMLRKSSSPRATM